MILRMLSTEDVDIYNIFLPRYNLLGVREEPLFTNITVNIFPINFTLPNITSLQV
jgi:hypothetical protein